LTATPVKRIANRFASELLSEDRYAGNGAGNLMPLNIDAIANLALPDAIQRLSARDTIIYALGLGYGDERTGTALRL
jgi:hypothetical protein